MKKQRRLQRGTRAKSLAESPEHDRLRTGLQRAGELRGVGNRDPQARHPIARAWAAVWRRYHHYLGVIIAHPHHYETAALMTAILLVMGHPITAELWLYAIVENITSALAA